MNSSNFSSARMICFRLGTFAVLTRISISPAPGAEAATVIFSGLMSSIWATVMLSETLAMGPPYDVSPAVWAARVSISASAALSWPKDVIAVPLKSTRMSGTVKPAVLADTTDDIVVLVLLIRLTSVERPVESEVSALTIEDVPVFSVVMDARAMLWPVETTRFWLTAFEMPVLVDVIADLTLLSPTVAVDRELEKIRQMLSSVEICALVEPVVALDCAVDSKVPTDVRDEIRVDSDVTPDSATLWMAEMELASEIWISVLLAWEVLVDSVDSMTVDTLPAVRTAVEALSETARFADSAEEIDVPFEVTADVRTDAETILLTTTTVLSRLEL